MASRAKVSQSIFSEVFPTVEECYRVAFDAGITRLAHAVAEATAAEQTWLERVRSGLVALLGFFDDEPSWARLLVLETPLNGVLTFECRQQLHELLARLLEHDYDSDQLDGGDRSAWSRALASALTSELVVGGAFSVIRTSMLDDTAGKLVELAPSLMAFIVAPHLGQAVAQAELEGKASSGLPAPLNEHNRRVRAISEAGELPIRVTHRTTMVLRAIARAPYSNNREIADAAGLSDEGQTSKLLARLERQGVIENVGLGPARGEPNAWLLTASGQRALALIGASPAPRPRTARLRGKV
ncbi:MAG TPA: winged helix-turn-helix domain-containing protein [Solirubrobacteraceae bacterium]|nr:winged helix-turn-helix domain-containing protein [Solirubrobacteraceae bacterium]